MAATTQYTGTPMVTVLDNRGLAVRGIAYHRHPGSPDVTGVRITRHAYDARGFLSQSADPRLHDAGRANFMYIGDLAGAVLRTQGADSGTAVVLNDAAGRPVMTVSNIRTADGGAQDLSQAVTRTWQYEGSALPGRPLSVTEQAAGGPARVSERFVYAGNTGAEQGLNLAGACVGHYDTAGLMQTDSIALTGAPLSVTRRLLKDADSPDTVADWQGADASAWNDLLAAEAYTTLSTADATGAALTATDAKGNRQRTAYDVAGQPSGRWLTVKGGTEQVIVRSLTYSAAGQKLREEHGNGVVTTYTYEPQTQRLTGVKTERPAGHAAGARVLQDLRYEYDPVGNVLKVRNDAEATRFWRNQKVVPESAYVYDSLYQLVSATGREMANAGQQGSRLPPLTVPLPTDSTAYTNYTRTYSYDSGGNLTQIRHSAPATNNGYTTDITVSDKSNRGVLSALTENPADVDALFTAGGQQLQLQPGQTLGWTARNELLRVRPVVREGDANDEESYRYDGGSQRVLKVSVQKTGGGAQTKRALYLPGLEVRSTATGATETESLHVLTVGEAGRAQVRVLHWESGRPADIDNNQVRYGYDTLIGSGQLEVDGGGSVISQEEYYPYGGTAVWTARSAAEADYKTVRYSGKERDATGLYYYGYRYYQPWAGRWLSSDPAGTVDGLNLFSMVRNNPVSNRDEQGLSITVGKQKYKDGTSFKKDPLYQQLIGIHPQDKVDRLISHYHSQDEIFLSETHLTNLVAHDINTSAANDTLNDNQTAQKNYLTRSGWHTRLKGKKASEFAPTQRPQAFWKGYKFASPGTPLNDIDGALSQLTSSAQISVYRTMSHAEADEILVNKNYDAIGKHLGDYPQALSYFHRDGTDKALLEFPLKPGAHEILFTPAFSAVLDSGNVTSVMARLAQLDLSQTYAKAKKGEGTLAGYIGIKPEEHGLSGFSLSLGDSKSRELFKRFVDIDNVKQLHRS